jgi:SET domain-containing protein
MELTSYKSSKTEVKDSPIKGKGLFAKEDIVKGELLFIKSGYIVDLATAETLEAELGEYCLQITDNFFLCPTTPTEVEATAIYINHSCDPNVAPDGQISFVALRDVKAGEELCYDYAMTTARDYRMECHCGSQNCRKMITGEDWKSSELKAKYGNHFVDFILKRQKALD